MRRNSERSATLTLVRNPSPFTLSTTISAYSEHIRLREQYRPAVEAGTESCVRCLERIPPPGGLCPHCGRETVAGNAGRGYCGWDLDHADDDRSFYYGPAHSCCNRSAGARKMQRQKAAKIWSRRWIVDDSD